MQPGTHSSASFGVDRALIVVAIYLGWAAITMLTGVAVEGRAQISDLIAGGIGRQFIFAALFLLALIAAFGWRDVGIEPPRPWRSVGLLWFPVLYLVFLFAVAAVLGLPDRVIVGFLFVNALLVGISEELMFRGVMYSGFRSRMPLWPAVWLTTVLFGAVHILNATLTGDWTGASIQAVAATMSGFLYLAIRIRTGSLFPTIIYHCLWDFCSLLVVVSAARMVSEKGGDLGEHLSMTGAPLWQQAVPLAFVAPLFVYGLMLMRKAEQTESEPGDGTDEGREL